MFHSLKGSANTRCYHCERLLYYFLLNYYLNLFFIGLTINCLLRWDMTKPASVSNLILLKFKEVLLLSLLAKHRAFRVLEANKVLTYFCSNSLQIVPFSPSMYLFIKLYSTMWNGQWKTIKSISLMLTLIYGFLQNSVRSSMIFLICLFVPFLLVLQVAWYQI